MLSKLLKHEIKATSRIFLPLYLVLLIFAVINRMLSSISLFTWQAPEVISMIIFVMILTGMFVITFVMMLQRFYKNLLSDEGYLMFTLPTKPWKHIISKLIVSMVWIVSSGIAAMTSIFVISLDRVMIAELMYVLSMVISEFIALFGASSVLFVLELFLLGITTLASGILIIYASIAIGHLFNRHRILASVGAFIALSTITQIFFAITGSLLSLMPIEMHFTTPNDFHAVGAYIIHSVLWTMIIFSGLLSVGYFVVTNYILSRHLNLE